MSIGSLIKKYRKEKGMTQVKLAEKADISRSYLADVEADRYKPSLSTLNNITNALGIPLVDIIADMEIKPGEESELHNMPNNISGLDNTIIEQSRKSSSIESIIRKAITFAAEKDQKFKDDLSKTLLSGDVNDIKSITLTIGNDGEKSRIEVDLENNTVNLLGHDGQQVYDDLSPDEMAAINAYLETYRKQKSMIK